MRFNRRMYAAGVAALLFATSCRSRTDSTPTTSTGVTDVSQATVWYMCRGGQTVLMVWVDSRASASESGGEYALNMPSGATVRLKSDAPGTVIIDGKAYDLSKGAVFQVRTVSTLPDVKQIAKSVSGVACTEEGIQSLARRDADIAAFVKTAHRSGRERRFQ